VTAVAVWDHKPTPRELLDARLADGWKPTPSGVQGGDRVLGYAACVLENGAPHARRTPGPHAGD
jgi:hypothetical protein